MRKFNLLHGVPLTARNWKSMRLMKVVGFVWMECLYLNGLDGIPVNISVNSRH